MAPETKSAAGMKSGHPVSLKTFEKWGIGMVIEHEVTNGMVSKVWCRTCAKYSHQIQAQLKDKAAQDVDSCIVGTSYATKHNINRHLNGNAHHTGIELKQINSAAPTPSSRVWLCWCWKPPGSASWSRLKPELMQLSWKCHLWHTQNYSVSSGSVLECILIIVYSTSALQCPQPGKVFFFSLHCRYTKSILIILCAVHLN